MKKTQIKLTESQKIKLQKLLRKEIETMQLKEATYSGGDKQILDLIDQSYNKLKSAIDLLKHIGRKEFASAFAKHIISIKKDRDNFEALIRIRR